VPGAGKAAAVRAVVLVGFMGAGKTSVGQALARDLGWRFEDLDQRIERREGRKIAEIFRQSGEAAFRRAEQEALRELLDELPNGSPKVIALGGGAFIHESNSKLIHAVKIPTIFLDAEVDELWRRCAQESAGFGVERPLLAALDDFRTLYEKRRPYYLTAALRHETAGKAVEEIAAELIQVLGLEAALDNQGETE
jgi:shikimate kinase